MRRYRLRVSAADAEAALGRLLALFPEGVEQEDEEGATVLTCYGERPPDVPGIEDGGPVEPDWADRWREFHRPVVAGGLWVGAPWHRPRDPSVVIDPGRAFGTGAHGSTRAALELLRLLPRSPALDLGCGSGVLAIAACRLGFRPVTAYDLDPLAVEAARDNARRNGVELEVGLRDVLLEPLPPAPLWIANLELAPLERLLARGDAPEAVLVSGLLASQTLGGEPRAVVEGWAAEVVRPRRWSP
jgi:ribosomal protein L11 methyltransferase